MKIKIIYKHDAMYKLVNNFLTTKKNPMYAE